MNNETMDNLRTAILRFLDYQLDSDTNADDSDAYTQLVAAYAIEWSCERLKSKLTDEQITTLIHDLRKQ